MGELFSKLGIDWKLLVANTITFFVVLWLLRKFAYRPLMEVMDKRRQTISDGLTNAEKAQQELQAVRQEKEKILAETRQSSMQMLQAATHDADIRRQELLAKAEADSRAMLDKTKQQMRAEQQKMMDQAKGQLADLVVAATSKVVAEQLDDKLQHKLADRAVKELMP